MASKDSKNLANAQAAALAAQIANLAAQLEFQKERMRLLELPQFAHLKQMDIDKLAFERSQAEWENALKEATMTGTYKGQPTLQWLEQQAKMFGVVDGQQTLEGKLSDAQIAQINHSMQLQSHAALLEDQKFGFERERWGAEFNYQMAKDLRDYGLSEAQITGMFNGQKTLAAQELDSKNTQAYLGLLSNLQGPGNAFKQMRVLGATPQGMRDMVAQWTGQYQAGGLASTGQAPGQAQVSDLFNPVYGQQFMEQGQVVPGGPTQPGQGAQWNVPPNTPVQGAEGRNPLQPGYPGTPAPIAPVPGQGTEPTPGGGYWTRTPPTGTPVPTGGVPDSAGAAGASAPAGEQGYTVSPTGTQAPVGAYNYTPTPSGQTQVYPPGIAAPPSDNQISTNTPGILPSQLNAENYKNMNKYGQEFLWGYLENLGWDKMAAQDAFTKSLPKYGGPATGTVQAGLGM